MATVPTTRTSTRCSDDRSAPWRQHWYPVAFAVDLTGAPRRFELNGHGYVLFRGADGGWQCLLDRCPHRAARLSDGVMRDGRLECLYHGWQFGSGGQCLHIPQLAEGQSIPARAHVPELPVVVRQGVVWVWPGLDDGGEVAAVPTVDGLDDPATSSVDFVIDLPYEQTLLVENVIDIAHIHIAHDGIRGGGLRELAGPLEFDVEDHGALGFAAALDSARSSGSANRVLRGARVEFRAPNLIHYESLYVDASRRSGLALYSLPIGRDRCRLLYRAYSNFRPRRDTWRPRWFEHWTQCTILEQDMDVVVGQAAELRRSGASPRELWLPIKSSDTLVLAYRRWLDEHARGWPHAIGFAATEPRPVGDAGPPAFDRLTMHTELCADCSRVHRRLVAARRPLMLTVVALLALAAWSDGQTAALAAALSVVVAAAVWALSSMRARFE